MITHCQHNLYIRQTTRDNALLHLGISEDIEIITKADLQKHGFLNLVLVPHCVHCITITCYDNKNLLSTEILCNSSGYCLDVLFIFYSTWKTIELCTVYKIQGQLKSGCECHFFSFRYYLSDDIVRLRHTTQ